MGFERVVVRLEGDAPGQGTDLTYYRVGPAAAPEKVHLQAALHAAFRRFNVLVCHRRFGKTVLCVNELIDQALRCTRERPRYAYLAPLYKQAKESKDTGGFHDFVEILKLYDKNDDNTILGNELFRLLTNLGEKLTKDEAKNLMKELCEPEDDEGFMPFTRECNTQPRVMSQCV